jgi:hypothetical protein
MSLHHTISERNKWNKNFEKLVQYKQQHGTSTSTSTSNIPPSSIIGKVKRVKGGNNNSSFDLWLDTQKKFWDEYCILGSDEVLDDRYRRLTNLGVFKRTPSKKGIISHVERWNDMYENLRGFKQNHGHVKVPERCNENPKLGRWVHTWRAKYRKYKKTNGLKGDSERMKCLEKLGLVDDISTGYEQRRGNKSNWDDMFNLLIEFKQKYGHVNVPVRHNANPKLGRWVSRLRNEYREHKRTNGQKGDPERMKRLESIGLVHDILAGDVTRHSKSNWDDMFNLLIEFKQNHGHLKVPGHWNENPKLGRWVRNCRYNYRIYKRSNVQNRDPEQRVIRLESIGLVDDILSKKHEDKETNRGDDKVFAPTIVSSTTPMFSSNTQNIAEGIPTSTGMKGKRNSNSGDTNIQADLDFLGSELRGGFWV